VTRVNGHVGDAESSIEIPLTQFKPVIIDVARLIKSFSFAIS